MQDQNIRTGRSPRDFFPALGPVGAPSLRRASFAGLRNAASPAFAHAIAFVR